MYNYFFRLIKFCKDNGGCTGDYNFADDDVDEDDNGNHEGKLSNDNISNDGSSSEAEDEDYEDILERLQSLDLGSSSTNSLYFLEYLFILQNFFGRFKICFFT